MTAAPVLVPVAEVDPKSLYLRSSVLSGEGDGLSFDLDQSGATLILTVKLADGSTVKQTLSMSDLATAWVNTVRVSA